MIDFRPNAYIQGPVVVHWPEVQCWPGQEGEPHYCIIFVWPTNKACSTMTAGNVVGFDLQCVALGTRRGRACPTISHTHTRGAGLTPGAGVPGGAATATTTTHPQLPIPGLTQPATSPRPSSPMPWLAWQNFRTITLATYLPVKTPHPRVCPSHLPWALFVLDATCLQPACLLCPRGRLSHYVVIQQPSSLM